MTDIIIEAQARLELIKEKLQKNREPRILSPNGLAVKEPTLAEWALEEIVCVMLDFLEEETASQPVKYVDLQGATVEVRNGYFKPGVVVTNGTVIVREDVKVPKHSGVSYCNVYCGGVDFVNGILKRWDGEEPDANIAD